MPADDFRKLSETEWNQLQERADRFAESLHMGTADDWESFLDGLPANLRRPVLYEMVKIDLDHRWSKGERPLLEEYGSKHEEIGDIGSLPVDLICEEFRIRRKRGQSPDLDDYFGRFPEQFSEVKTQLEKEHGRDQTQTHTPTNTGASVRMETVAASESAPVKPARKRLQASHLGGDNYERTELLGAGHFGEVWKAKAPGGIEVAVKIVTQPIEKDAAQRELQALELVKNLRHPCLLATHRIWIESDKLHIAMELADGTLRDRFKQCKKQDLPGIPRDELLMYFADAAEGLDFLHTRSVFHRDIKPDNIMILHGHAKVADFGLARLQERQMMTVSFAGTPVYMAPEAWGGKGGPASDQYSLAFAYAELRQGKRPIEGNDFTEVMANTLEAEANLEGIPPNEARIVKRALAKKPEERFTNCSEFVAALARATGTPVRARSPIEADLKKQAAGQEDDTYKETYQESGAMTASSSSRPRGPGKRKLLLLAASLGLLVGAAFAIYNFAFKGTPTPTSEFADKDKDKDRDRDRDKERDKDKLNDKDKEPDKDKKDTDKKNLIPPEEKPVLPPKFVVAAGASVVPLGKKKGYDRIEFPLKNGDKALFVLVRPADGKPFYMMEYKVWNSLFAEFAEANPAAVARTEWRKESPVRLPAVRVNVSEADQFARWLGGRLPTAKEWDEAAGLNKRAGRDGPSLKDGTAAVGRSEPRAFDDPIKDDGPVAVRDMAGNGREFTRDALTKTGSRTVPIDSPTATDLVVLRGRNFTLANPLTYADLEFESKTPQTQYYLKASPYTGFRVMLDVPE